MSAGIAAAVRRDPQHWVLTSNVHAVRRWLAQQGQEKKLPLELEAKHEFQLLERAAQIPRNGAAQFENLDALIVVDVEKLRGELLPATALVAFQDHKERIGYARLRNGLWPTTGHRRSRHRPSPSKLWSVRARFAVRG